MILDRTRTLGRRLLLALWRYVNPPASPDVIPWRPRLAVAIVIGLVATAFAYHQLTGRAWLASDFEYDLRAARDLLNGLNPYENPSSAPGLPYPFDAVFPYPLLAAIYAVPFTLLDSYNAGALYVGVLSGLMAYAVTKDGWWRLSIFLSPCYFVTASVANWSPLLVAAAFLPALFPLAIVKPTLLMPIALNYPSFKGYVATAVAVLVSVLVFPSWPVQWLTALSDQPGGKYALPLFMGATVFVLLAGLAWRRREARLLLMFALIPQHAFFYDQLLLWLIPRTLGQSLAFSLVTWGFYFSWANADPFFRPLLAATPQGPALQWTAPLFYLPALALVGWQVYRDRQTRRAVEPAPVVGFEESVAA